MKTSILRKSILIFSIILSTVCLGLFFYTLLFAYNDRLLNYLTISILFMAIYILERIFKIHLSDLIHTIYFLFIFFYAYLGFIINFYGVFPHYDKIMHSGFGYIGSLFGLFIICQLTKIDKLNNTFILIFIFAISLMCGALWEIFEFLTDNVLKTNMQGPILNTIDGLKIRDVKDSMYDLICNLIGAIVFIVHYNFFKNKAFFQKIQKDFSKKLK